MSQAQMPFVKLYWPVSGPPPDPGEPLTSEEGSMTHEEREAETQRLMAALDGSEILSIDESGSIQTPDAIERRSCVLCHVYLDDMARDLDGNPVCPDCMPFLRVMLRQQFDCLLCDGKRLFFQGAGQGWHPCMMCQGRGWITGLDVFLNADDQQAAEHLDMIAEYLARSHQ